MSSKTIGTSAGRAQREHYWDAIRAFLMLLGIPYHTALSYRPGQEWIVHSGGGAQVFTYLAQFLHLFRMPTFFIIAGYFAALLLARRTPGAWLRGRLLRLGVPCLACMATLVPLMNLACELSNLPLGEALASWRQNSLTSAGYWVRHLWFVIVLLYCCAAAAAAVRRYPGLRSAVVPPRVDAWIAGHFLLVLTALGLLVGLWEAAAIEAFYKVGLATNVPQQLLRIDDLIACAPYFLIGCLLGRSPRVLGRLGTFSPTIALLAAVLTTVSLVYLDLFSPWLGRFVGTLAALTTAQVMIALARRVADRPHRLIQELVPASFVIYLVHMPIVVVLVALAASLPVPVIAKALAVMLLAFALSFGAWRVISRSAVLSFAFNGDRLAPPLRPRLAG